MNPSSSSLRHLGVAVSMLTALLVGCATNPEAAQQALETEVKALADKRWVALVDGDMRAAYDLTMPSYRAATDFRAYRLRYGSGAAWRSGKAVAADCDAERCKVRVRVEYSPPILVRSTEPAVTHIEETWVKEAGQWWHFPR